MTLKSIDINHLLYHLLLLLDKSLESNMAPLQLHIEII